MKYTINGYSQEKLIEYDIDLSSSLILRVIADMYTSNGQKLEYKMLNDDKYMWCTYGYLLEQIPILGTERTLIRKIDSLIEKNILKKIILPQRNGKTGRYLYISLGENYQSLTEYNSNDKMSSEQMTKCQEGSDKMSFDLMTNCHDKDSSISDSSISNSSSSCTTDGSTEKLDKESVEFKNNIVELKNIIANSTGVAMQYIEGQMKIYLYKDIIKQLLAKIKDSKYLMGEKEEKPKVFVFTSKQGISRIMAGNYDDFKSKNKASNKLDTQDIEYTVSDAQKQVLEALGL